MHSVELRRASGPVVLSRPQTSTATLHAPGQPERRVALPRRPLRDCIAEELRRLDADEVYAEVLSAGLAMVGRPGPAGGRPMTTEIVMHSTAEMLAATTAARLVTRLVDLQSAGRIPAVALTGGGVGIDTLAKVAHSPARDAVDWGRVEIYWGDERFVPQDDPERNEKQAREALLDHVDVDPARVHAMAPSDGEFGDDPDDAAADYARLLAGHDRLDLVLLGMGPEGHVASVFPESPAVYEDRPVVAVRNCPKPPPTRVSLTLPTIRAATEVWLLVAGEAKAGAVAMALGGAGEVALPAAGATGSARTLWLLDRAAASKLPPGIARMPV
jgi:6-phosphogluconolactonase